MWTINISQWQGRFDKVREMFCLKFFPRGHFPSHPISFSMELVAQSFLACVFSKYKHKPGGSFREVAFSLTQGIGEVGQRGREEGWNLGGLDFESLSIGKSFCHFGKRKGIEKKISNFLFVYHQWKTTEHVTLFPKIWEERRGKCMISHIGQIFLEGYSFKKCFFCCQVWHLIFPTWCTVETQFFFLWLGFIRDHQEMICFGPQSLMGGLGPRVNFNIYKILI